MFGPSSLQPMLHHDTQNDQESVTLLWRWLQNVRTSGQSCFAGSNFPAAWLPDSCFPPFATRPLPSGSQFVSFPQEFGCIKPLHTFLGQGFSKASLPSTRPCFCKSGEERPSVRRPLAPIGHCIRAGNMGHVILPALPVPGPNTHPLHQGWTWDHGHPQYLCAFKRTLASSS